MSKVCVKCGAILQGNKIIYDIDSSLDCKHKWEDTQDASVSENEEPVVNE
jgi:hypothetical protein